MNRIPVHNNTAMPMYVGSEMIPPGETRHFALEQVPMHLRPAPVVPVVEAPAADPIAELAEKSAKDIIAAIPDLGVEQLEKLGDLEQLREKPRSTVLGAIGEALLARAGGGSDTMTGGSDTVLGGGDTVNGGAA